MLGGSPIAYLPHKDGKVVCGCFNTGERYNPGAPEEVLFGREHPMPDVEKSAEMVYQQGSPIPIFIYRAAASWEYVGDYRCTALLNDANLLSQKMEEHPQRGKIKGILRFEKV
jgi:hypothetical protein